LLGYARTDRQGYRHYKSDPAICRDCTLLASAQNIKKIAMAACLNHPVPA